MKLFNSPLQKSKAIDTNKPKIEKRQKAAIVEKVNKIGSKLAIAAAATGLSGCGPLITPDALNVSKSEFKAYANENDVFSDATLQQKHKDLISKLNKLGPISTRMQILDQSIQNADFSIAILASEVPIFNPGEKKEAKEFSELEKEYREKFPQLIESYAQLVKSFMETAPKLTYGEQIEGKYELREVFNKIRDLSPTDFHSSREPFEQIIVTSPNGEFEKLKMQSTSFEDLVFDVPSFNKSTFKFHTNEILSAGGLHPVIKYEKEKATQAGWLPDNLGREVRERVKPDALSIKFKNAISKSEDYLAKAKSIQETLVVSDRRQDNIAHESADDLLEVLFNFGLSADAIVDAFHATDAKPNEQEKIALRETLKELEKTMNSKDPHKRVVFGMDSQMKFGQLVYNTYLNYGSFKNNGEEVIKLIRSWSQN